MAHLAKRLVVAAILAATFTLACVVAAGASSTQFTAIQDEGLLLSPDPAVRNAALDEMQALGVESVKLAMIWRRIAPSPDSSTKPAGFDATDPAAYGSGFAQYRSVVDAIEARGMRPWIVLIVPAPKWAAPKASKRQQGVYLPDTKEFGMFSEAAGKSFPEVSIWSIYNEPNHIAFLEPQVLKTGIVTSAEHYRNLFYAARAGLSSSGHDADNILFGAMAPRASAPTKGATSVQPVLFLREFFCLDGKLKPYKGAAARARGCTGKYKKILASGFAYHPYTGVRSPLTLPPSPNDALIGQLPRLYKVLDAAYKQKRLSQKKIKLWNAEFGYQSDPPDPSWTPIKLIPSYSNIAEYISWKDKRVVNFHQYQLYDEKPIAGFQSGLRFIDGTKKPAIYDAFQLPLVVEKTTGSKVHVWGGIRAFNGAPQTVDIQIKNGSSFQTVTSVFVTNTAGYFQTDVALAGAAGKKWRLAWNGQVSREASVIKTIKLRK
ncbi:MAG: hypothetical protein JHC87_03510 [Thermoleophilaceae bacterium]|nr:hypothetical protein [Thermoleophilaceae bacterium]